MQTWFTENPAVSAEAKRVLAEDLASSIEWILGNGVRECEYRTLNELVEEVRESQRMNQVLWGLTSFGNCNPPKPTFEENVDYLRDWLEMRLAWVREQYRL